MSRDDPFSGIQLSEQATPGKLEQRLFQWEAVKPEPPVVKPPEEQPSDEEPRPLPRPHRSRPAGTKPGELRPVALSKSRFELAETPLYKASYVFTQEELDALEDLKIALRRELDAKVTKNDLMRLALHMLLDEHRSNGSRSYATRNVRKG